MTNPLFLFAFLLPFRRSANLTAERAACQPFRVLVWREMQKGEREREEEEEDLTHSRRPLTYQLEIITPPRLLSISSSAAQFSSSLARGSRTEIYLLCEFFAECELQPIHVYTK